MLPDLNELTAYVDLDEEDRRRLAAFWPHVEPAVAGVIDHFYDKVLAFEGTRRVLSDEAQVERLKCTLVVWLEELLRGPHDAGYRERRLRIGQRHVEVGLESRYMYTAGQVVADDLAAVALRALPPAEAVATISAVHRALTVDLALMTSSYVAGRERASARELQDLLVQHLRVTVFLVDVDGLITAATPATVALFGNAPIVGRSWVQVVPEELRAAAQLEKQVERALATGVDVALPRVAVTTGGADRTYAVHIVPLQHPLARVLLQIEDLTEAVSVEARLRRTEALAQLGSLSAAVAHELRNPLAGISGAIQVISRSIPSTAPYAPIMVKVEAEIRRLDGLVSDLLAFARPTSPELQVVDLGAAARRALDLARGDHAEPVFSVQGSGRAYADADLVHQILLNLLQNAIQAIGGRDHQGRVELTVADGSITVSDDGPGVAPDVAGHVFEPFFTTKTRGTGLGLAICQRFAEAMGGEITLRPRGPLGGATFELRLRRAG
jgi:signal transduction histidine kinase